LIDISNPSADKWIYLLDGELTSRQITISGTLVYSNHATYEAVKSDAFNNVHDNYAFKFGLTGEEIAGVFLPSGMSDTLPSGDKVTTSISFNSSNEVIRTPQWPSTGVQIGQAIITGEGVWHNSSDEPTFGLLLADGSAFSAATYPRLALVYPLLSLPNVPTEAGSPFPYKIVADYTGA